MSSTQYNPIAPSISSDIAPSQVVRTSGVRLSLSNPPSWYQLASVLDNHLANAHSPHSLAYLKF